jgi:hypothetical protein
LEVDGSLSDVTVDSGAQKTIFPTKLIGEMGITVTPLARKAHVTFANGEREEIVGEALVGEISVLVADVVEPLLSVVDLVDAGHFVVMSSGGGAVTSCATGESATLMRTAGQWRMKMEDLVSLERSTIPTTYPTNIDDYRAHTVDMETTSESDLFEEICHAVYTVKTTESGGVRKRVIELHKRMGCATVAVMCRAVTGPRCAWRNSGVTGEQIRRVMRDFTCLACALAKRNKAPIASGGGERKEGLLPGEIISSDPVGKISPSSAVGHCYFFLFKDIATGYLHAVPAKTKDEFLPALRKVYDFYSRHGWKPRILRTDGGKEEVAANVEAFLVAKQMTREMSAPYSQYQNSVERDVQTVCKGVSAMLHNQMWLRADRWDLALLHFVDCRNASPNAHHSFKSPRQRVTRDAIDLNRTFNYAFGDIVRVSLPVPDREWKFDVRNDVGIYVGQPSGSVESHLIYWPYTHSVSERSGVSKLEISEQQLQEWCGRREAMRNGSLPYAVFRDAYYDLCKPSAGGDEELEKLSGALSGINDGTMNVSAEGVRERQRATRGLAGVPPTDRKLRSQAKDLPSVSDPYRTFLASSSQVTSHTTYAVKFRTADTPTVNTALKRDDAELWQEAIRKEVDMLMERRTLQPVARGEVPRGAKIVHSTMQLKLKRLADNTIDKRKARCCARGDQLAGDVELTYSPTISALAYAVVHQLAIIDDMELCTIDTVGAYLYQDYPDDAEPLYLKLEPGVAEACGLEPCQIYRVRKYLYGLPDAGRAYYRAYSAHLKSNGYLQTISDPCLFMKEGGGARTYVWIHVDDTFVASTSATEITLIQQILRKEFEITVSDNVNQYLGVQMERLSDGSVKLTQPKLLAQLFEEFKPGEMSRHASAPMYGREEEDPDTSPIERRKYQHLLGALMYLLKSRPDIATAISFAATHAVTPTVAAYEELLYCVKYLYQTQEEGLVLMQGAIGRDLVLRCHVDASYLVHPDSKSHTGYCMSFGEIGSFYSKSSKQKLVTTSSTHAEARAAFQLIQDIVFVVHLCKELHRPISLPVIVLEDNQPLIDLSGEISGKTKQSKHFLMLINYIREKVEEGLIEFKKVASELNHSDVLTKRVVGQDFRYKAQGLLGLQPGEMRVPSVACKRKKGVGEGVHFDVGPAIADAGGHRSMTEQGPVSTGIGDRYS